MVRSLYFYLEVECRKALARILSRKWVPEAVEGLNISKQALKNTFLPIRTTTNSHLLR